MVVVVDSACYYKAIAVQEPCYQRSRFWFGKEILKIAGLMEAHCLVGNEVQKTFVRTYLRMDSEGLLDNSIREGGEERVILDPFFVTP